MIVVFENIKWDWDEDDDDEFDSPPDLPTRVMMDERYFIKEDLDGYDDLQEYLTENGADFLSDEFDFYVDSFTIELVEDRWNFKWSENNIYNYFFNKIEHLKMKKINREEIKDLDFIEIMKKENHHNHEILQDMEGKLYWRQDDNISAEIEGKNINNNISNLLSKGLNKNSEEYRRFYRDIGYSLFGYWEIFYCKANNPICNEYKNTSNH
jgi:hypothetical protein